MIKFIYYIAVTCVRIVSNLYSNIKVSVLFRQAGRDLKFISLSMTGCFSVGALLLLVYIDMFHALLVSFVHVLSFTMH